MGPYVMFVECTLISTDDEHKSGPILLDANSEKEASSAAKAVADFAFDKIASRVIVRIVSGDSGGRPIAEIRRPISN